MNQPAGDFSVTPSLAGQYLGLSIGADLFAIPRDRVLGVSRLHPLSLLPRFGGRATNAPFSQWHGSSIAPLRAMLGYPEWSGPESSVAFVQASGVSVSAPWIGLIADALPLSLSIGIHEFFARESSSAIPAFIQAKTRINGTVVRILDLDRLLRDFTSVAC